MKRERFSKRWSPSFDRLPQQPWLSAVELANGRPYCGQKRKLINRQWTLLGRLSCQLKRFEKVQNLKFKTWKFANESFHLHLRSFHFNSPVLGGLVQYGLKVIGETDEEKEFQ